MSKAQRTEVAPPPGADPERVDNWETNDGVTSRLVWSHAEVLTNGFDIRLVASQRLDGSIITDDPSEVPLVYIGGDDYSLDDARLVVRAILEIVKLADEWVAK
jgi:hypothetical protein